MTLDELTSYIVKGDREGLCRAMAPLDAAQREALADDPLKLYLLADEVWGKVWFEEIDKASLAPDVARIINEMSAMEYADWRLPRLTAGLAVLGLGRQKSHLGTWFADDLRDMPQRVTQVLNDRRPPWLADWIKRESRPSSNVTIRGIVTWPVERALIRSGALPPDTSDGYIERFAGDLPGFVANSKDFEVTTDTLPKQPVTLVAALLADPELLTHEIWRLFEVQTTAFDYSWSPWQPALCELIGQSQLDRRRMLEVSVRAMGAPFRPTARAGYVSFHVALNPTIDERAELVSEYLSLLANDSPLVAGAAIGAVEELAKAKRLNAEAFLNACSPLFRLAKKGPPSKALKLIKKLLKAHPSCRSLAARVLPVGLGHESPDVQGEALDLLESMTDELTGEIQESIASFTEQVAAALRSRLEALTTSAVAEQSKPVVAPVAASKASQDVIDVSLELQAATGITAARQAIVDEADPFPVPIDPRMVPRRDPAQTVQPIKSLDELIDSISAFIERVDDVMEAERILDGIFRFRLEKPADFEHRVAPLKKRIEAKSEPYSGSVLDVAADAGLSQVIRCWLHLPEIHREWGGWLHSSTRFLRMRTQELLFCFDLDRQFSSIALSQLPSLSLPTHRDGWLDPVELVRRIKVYRDSSDREWGLHKIVCLDLAQALLRLTPDGRSEALAFASDLSPNPYVQFLRFALGEPVELKQIGRNHEALFLAAAHCRAVTHPSDRGTLPSEVPEVVLREDGSLHVSGPVTDDLAFPGDLLPRIYSWNAAVPQKNCWGVSPSNRDWLVEWQSLCWPINRRPMCLLGSLWQSSSPAFLQNLLERDTTWHEEAARLAVLAMSTDVPRAKGLVTDALIDAFADQRVDPRLLGRHLAANVDHLLLNRVAAVLSEVARVSPLHHWSVFATLDHFLARLAATPKDLHQLLTPFLESATQVGRIPSDESRSVLQSISGSSKTAKLAKQLCGLSPDASRMISVRDAALSSRLNRGRRFTTR